MAHGSLSVSISLAEQPQFKRLVRFLEDAESLGRINADDELSALVNETRADLLTLRSEQA